MENVKKIIEEKKRILDDIQRNGYLEITESSRSNDRKCASR